jgi:hypothetical protein
MAAGTRNDDLDKDLGVSPSVSLGDNLTDDALESEIELVSELVVAATSSDRPLRQDEVDHLLGLGPKEASSASRSGS